MAKLVSFIVREPTYDATSLSRSLTSQFIKIPLGLDKDKASKEKDNKDKDNKAGPWRRGSRQDVVTVRGGVSGPREAG